MAGKQMERLRKAQEQRESSWRPATFGGKQIDRFALRDAIRKNHREADVRDAATLTQEATQ